MDKLKDFIDNNRGAFDNGKLPEGHFERFERKLRISPVSRGRLYGFILLAAASVALFVYIGTTIYHEENNQYTRYTSEIRQEIEGLCFYYDMQMADILKQMETISEKDNSLGAAQLLEETKRILAESRRFEENIVPTLPSSDRGLFAVDQYYKGNLQSLHIMLGLIEEIHFANEN